MRFDVRGQSQRMVTRQPFSQIRIMALTGKDTTWDADIWDTGVYGTATRVQSRMHVGRTGRSWRCRVRQPAANKPVTLLKIQATAEMMTTKR